MIAVFLFQTVYLTIADEQREGFRSFDRLDYPYPKVRVSLNDELPGCLGRPGRKPIGPCRALCTFLEANELGCLAVRLRAYLSGIPYQRHATTSGTRPVIPDLARYEAWNASLLHLCFRSIGVDLRVDDASHRWRADLVVLTGGQLFVPEFKMAKGNDDAAAALNATMAQIRERSYAETYRDRGGPVHVIGVVCGREARNFLEIRTERG